MKTKTSSFKTKERKILNYIAQQESFLKDAKHQLNVLRLKQVIGNAEVLGYFEDIGGDEHGLHGCVMYIIFDNGCAIKIHQKKQFSEFECVKAEFADFRKKYKKIFGDLRELSLPRTAQYHKILEFNELD